MSGEEKRAGELTLLELAPVIVQTGILGKEESEELAAEIKAINEDETILVAMPRKMQVWAVKTN